MRNERGELLRDYDAIQHHVFEYFRELYLATEESDEAAEMFECDRVVPIDDELNSALIAEIETTDIYKAVKASADRKSPGEDGLPAEFYKRAFDVIHKELNMVMNEAITTQFPSEFTSGTIVLVKKRRNDDTVRAYRPITLLNVDFRIFSKILKVRLEYVLRSYGLPSEAQKCCNPGRNIFQATLALKDKISALIAEKRAGKLISFDLDHAFDRVSHRFLHRTMRSLGIHQNFIGLLKRITERSTSRIMINGLLSHSFPIERSVRQGDPLSMMLFALYLHPLLTRIERVCGSDLCVAYADDISVVTTSTQKIQNINELFDQFERVAGAKLNRHKTISINVGAYDENRCIVPWLQTRETVKILGIVFANSIREMVKLNWDALVSKTAQIIWLHSLRNLNLCQKITLLNNFILSKMWYVASIIPPYTVHIGKITATMGSFVWRGFPARVPMQQLARSIEEGGLKLQLPALKCKALLINRHLREMDVMPFYNSFLTNTIRIPADLPCLRQIRQHVTLLPPQIQQNISNELIHRFFIEQTEQPRIERKHPNHHWRRIWRNIASRKISSRHRSGLYLLVNEKTQHRKLMHTMQRADGASCVHCQAVEETLVHKLSECPRVAAVWARMQRKMTETLGGWQQLSCEDLLRPSLQHINHTKRNELLRNFVQYANFIDEDSGTMDIASLEFYLEVN